MSVDWRFLHPPSLPKSSTLGFGVSDAREPALIILLNLLFLRLEETPFMRRRYLFCHFFLSHKL